ncbi:MAG: P-II family nitrogen regulator [Actinobacteria bacterium]|nr:P-II family nitrogen regulator [Actinomycetota bacterium]
MKLVTVMVKPFRLEPLKNALAQAGVRGLTVIESSGHGRQGGHIEVYRGAEYRVELIPKLKVEVLVEDQDVPEILQVMTSAMRTGKTGDGKIWVVPVEDVTRVRTGERGSEAI